MSLASSMPISVGDQAGVDAVDPHAVAELAGLHGGHPGQPVDRRTWSPSSTAMPGNAIVAATEEMLTIGAALAGGAAGPHGAEGVLDARARCRGR